MPVNDWSATTLCIDADLIDKETDWPDWTTFGDTFRAEAKRQIEKALRFAYRKRELATDEADVLDLISNPEELKDAAVYKTLELVAQDNIVVDGDRWTLKAKHYAKEFDKEWSRAVAMLHFDADESGTIEDEEKYTGRMGVRLSRGGGVL